MTGKNTQKIPRSPNICRKEMLFYLSASTSGHLRNRSYKKVIRYCGQKVAEAGGFVSANIYSSVSGTVKAIEPRRTPAGAKVNAIVIENDGEFKEAEFQAKPYQDMTRDEVLAAIKDAGIVGLGGAGFPTHVKLAPKYPDAIEYIIVNGAECEPYITVDYRIMTNTPEVLVEGLNIVLDVFPKAKRIIRSGR